MLDILAASIEAVPPDVPILFGLGATQLAGIAAAIGVGIASFLGLRKGGEAQKLAPQTQAAMQIGGLFLDGTIGHEIVAELRGIKEAIRDQKLSETEERMERAIQVLEAEHGPKAPRHRKSSTEG